jgi:hypothetical protein
VAQKEKGRKSQQSLPVSAHDATAIFVTATLARPVGGSGLRPVPVHPALS